MGTIMHAITEFFRPVSQVHTSAETNPAWGYALQSNFHV